jgi:hypothetical protein
MSFFRPCALLGLVNPRNDARPTLQSVELVSQVPRSTSCSRSAGSWQAAYSQPRIRLLNRWQIHHLVFSRFSTPKWDGPAWFSSANPQGILSRTSSRSDPYNHAPPKRYAASRAYAAGTRANRKSRTSPRKKPRTTRFYAQPSCSMYGGAGLSAKARPVLNAGIP